MLRLIIVAGVALFVATSAQAIIRAAFKSWTRSEAFRAAAAPPPVVINGGNNGHEKVLRFVSHTDGDRG